MAATDLDDRRARALAHGTLRGGRNHLVFRCDHVPAWLGLPSRLADSASERVNAPRDLGVRHEGCLLAVHIGGEGGGKLSLVEEQVAVLRRQDRRHRGARRRIRDERGDGLTFVGGEGGY